MFVRPPTDVERQRLEAGLRSSEAFVMRRCQVLLASARGQRAPEIANNLGCDDQTARNAIVAFNETGLDCLVRKSSAPHRTRRAISAEGAERLRSLLRQSPRSFGKPTSLWTLGLVAEVCFEQGITSDRVSIETIRVTLIRLGIRWTRAKQWITSPDPAYARKKGPAIA